jgi:tetratricopeptide (TPR) repeat protein
MNAIVPGYLAKGEVDLAAELANAIDDPFGRDRLLIQVAEKSSETDDVEYALQLAEAIEDAGMQVEAMERIAVARVNKGDVASAAEIAGSMIDADNVHAALAVHQSANGNDAAAEAHLANIDFLSAHVSSLMQIAAGKIAAGSAETAVALLDRAREINDEIEHDEEQIRTLCELGSLYIQARRNDKAIAAYDKAKSLADLLTNMHRDRFLVMTALGSLQAGSEELCDRALDLVTDKTHMASALLHIARREWEAGEKDTAVETIEEAYAIIRSQRDIETRDSRAKNQIWASIAVEFAVLGLTDRAIEIAQENADPREQTSALSRIAQVLELNGDATRGREALDAIEEDADRVFALISLADLKENSGAREDSIAFLKEAASQSDSIAQPSGRASALTLMIERFASAGETERATLLGREALGVIGDIKDETSQAVALASLAQVYDDRKLEVGTEEMTVVGEMLRRIDLG